MTKPDPDQWIRPYSDHPAYETLVAKYRRRTSCPEHLAFLALDALAGRFHVVPSAGEFHLDYYAVSVEFLRTDEDEVHAYHLRGFPIEASRSGYGVLAKPERSELPSDHWPRGFLSRFRLTAPVTRLWTPEEPSA